MKNKFSPYFPVFLALSILVCGCGAPSTSVKNSHYDQLSGITKATVKSIKTKWKMEFPDLITHKPIVRNGRVFFADWGGNVYCLDAGNGSVVWQKNLESTDTKMAWRGFSGTGVLGPGLLFEASMEGTLYAVDIKDGSVKWKSKFTGKPYAGNTGKLLYANGMVYVGVCSMDEAFDASKGFTTDFQGSVCAFKASDGSKAWELKTANGSENGAAIWGGFAFDGETNTLFFGTGNNYTGKASDMSDAIIAADASTGELKWSKQFTQGDVWTMAKPAGPDFDFGTEPQLFEAVINGSTRKLLAACQKNGMLWVLDRATAEKVWSASLGEGAAGGGFLGAASVGRYALYAWSNNKFMYKDPGKSPMDIAAFDLATGKLLWKNANAQPAWVTTAGFATGDLYFVGSLDGKIRGYDTWDGTLVWTSPKMDSISTSIACRDKGMYFATGIPKMFGGTGDKGIVYCMDVE